MKVIDETSGFVVNCVLETTVTGREIDMIQTSTSPDCESGFYAPSGSCLSRLSPQSGGFGVWT